MAKRQPQDIGLVKEIPKVLLDDSDFLRVLIQENLQQIIESEFSEFLQAHPYERSEGRQGYRNGSYTRKLKTRVGTVELEILRDCDGNFSTDQHARCRRLWNHFSEQVFPGAW